MGRALLINPSYFRTYASNEGGLAFPVYPILSLAALAGAVRERGHEAQILDLSYRKYDPDLLKEIIRREKPDLVAITATTPLVNQMRDISYLVKDVAPGTLCLGGGAHPSALPHETLAQSALDAVGAGEQDLMLADILDGKPLSELPGVYWRDGLDSEIQHNPAQPLRLDLDSLPMPAWDIYPRECERWVTKIIARHPPITTIEFSRGCVYRCDFCGSKNTMGLGYRKKSPERCAEEMALLERLGFREAVIVDDIFTSDMNWAADVCRAIIDRGVKVAWTCTNGIRVDACNRELFELMKKAGCYRVYFGMETGNEEVLRSFGKGGRATLEKGREAAELARAAGLEPNGFFQIGLSADTAETMQETIDYAKSLPLETMKAGITVPFPGTPMFDALRRAGKIKTLDWDDYNVYQNAEEIFDHPTLEWDVIRYYLKKFYSEVYFKNPALLLRRLRFMVRNHEVFWTVYYTIKFFFILRSTENRVSGDNVKEDYAYHHLWGPLDLDDDSAIRTYEVPKVVKLRTRRQPQPAAARQAHTNQRPSAESGTP